MASPARQAREFIQSKWPGATVSARGRGFIEHTHPADPRKKAFETQVGGKWHYGSAPYSQANEVDTTWQSSGGAWDWEAVKNDFHCYVRDSVPVSYRYEAGGHFVELTVNAIEWVNDEGQSEAAASFSQVTPTISDDRITWPGIATGWDVSLSVQTARLAKYLVIDSLAHLGSPSIGGTNPALSFDLRFQKSAGLDVYVNDVLWDEKANNPLQTSGDIEFRDSSSGDPVFWFKRPVAWDDDQDEINTITASQYTRKTGNNLFVSVRVPWDWLEAATFPITIDPTVDEQVGASADDAGEVTDITCSYTVTLWNIDESAEWDGFRWSSVVISNGATIDTAYLTVQYTTNGTDESHVSIDFEDGSNPAQFTNDSNNISSRTGTTTTVTWDDNENVGADVDQTTDELKTIIQELVDSYDYSSGAPMVCRFNAVGLATEDCSVYMYDDSTTKAVKLHIEYTAGGESYTQDISGSFGSNGGLHFLLGTDRVLGAFSPAGGVGVLVAANPLGIVGPGGAVVKETATSKTGTLSFAGILGGAKMVYRAIVGAIGPTGTLSKQIGKLVSGAVAPAGALIKAISAPLVGIVGPGGGVIKETATSKLGTLSFSGALAGIKTVLQALAGAIGPSGTLTVQVGKVLSGTLTSAGALVKAISAPLAGIVGPGGAVVKETAVSKLGSLGFSGALAGLKAIVRAVSGAIGPSGTLSVQIGKLISGAISPAGSLVKQVGKLLSGILSFAGALAGEIVGGITQAVGGVIGPTGSITVQVGKLAAGVSSFTGAVGKAVAAVREGIVGPGGAVVKETATSKLGSLSFSGIVAGLLVFGQAVGGVIGPSGTLSKQIGKGLAGVVAAAGAAGKGLTTSLGGVLSFSGTVGSSLVGLATGIVNLTLKARTITLSLIERSTGLTLKNRKTDITPKRRS